MNKKICLKLLLEMKRIRVTEETIAKKYVEQKMRCPTHLSSGQEAVAAGVGFVLRKDDLVVSGHRAHAHYLAKGGNLPAMISEIYGKATGCSGGKGGSMHLIDEKVGFMGSTAIVGGTVPVGVGLAYSIKLKKTDQVSCIFMGDAVAETGVLFESVNFSVLKGLPVLFICENNLYSVYSPLKIRQPKGRKIHEMLSGLGLVAGHGNGNDVGEVVKKVEENVENIRSGGGPHFLEFDTYRWREHCGPNFDNDLGYRAESEYLKWRERDPITLFEKRLLREGTIDLGHVKEIDEKVNKEIQEAFKFADKSPYPASEEAYTKLYSM